MFCMLQVSCGQTFTLAITEDGMQVFAWGEAEQCAFGSREIAGDHFSPMVWFSNSIYMCINVHILALGAFDALWTICKDSIRK